MDILRDITIGMTTIVVLTRLNNSFSCQDPAGTEEYFFLPLWCPSVFVLCCWGSWQCVCVLVHESVWGPVSALNLEREDILSPKSCLTPIFGFKVWDLVRVKIRSCILYGISQGLSVHKCWLIAVWGYVCPPHVGTWCSGPCFYDQMWSLLICYLSPTKPRQHPLLVVFHGHQFPCSYARL